MNKHAIPTIWPDVEKQEPAHSKGWTLRTEAYDRLTTDIFGWPHIPGRHAKPFAAHHPARPITYDAQGTVTPLTPARPILDAIA